MWCPKCQAEVAAEASASDWRLLCTACGTDVVRQPGGSELPPPASESTRPARNPRELLAKWAEEDASDPLGLPKPASALPPPSHADREPIPFRPAGSPGRELWTVSSGELKGASGGNPGPVSSNPPVASAATRARRPFHLASARPVYGDRARAVALADVDDSGSDRWLPLVGQMFAYLGVVTLFVGSILVLLGYFGGVADYAPTGWIVATAGQMLLFLGVVTLISAGLRETSETVRQSLAEFSRRVEALENELAYARESELEADERPARAA